MSLTPGTRLGPYEILSALGAGGMGEVYRARDTRLKREVALKILPASFADDPDRLGRFQREAEVLASLNHPNIAHIYGFDEAGGVKALVMELVEGPTLAERIAQGAIPLDEALAIAKQIAEALEAAHERGIIHRDLKPANVKVRADGTVKVLDFGLAKAMDPARGSSPSMSMSPTITTPAMTQAGMILGTAAYMSPEQARGKAVDKRADIWAFGCVLYEMLTGQRAFGGEDVTVTLARVLEREPDFDAFPASVPARVRQALRVCLRKDPKQRVGDIRDVRLALEGAFETAAPDTVASHASRATGTRLAWIAFAAAVLAAAGLAIPAVRYVRKTPASPPEMRVEINTPATGADPLSFALSPDGRQIVFVASGDSAPRLWLRSLASTSPQPLAGTEGATFPFWSPDSRSLGFFSGGALKRLELAGGQPQVVATPASSAGGTWNADGIILFRPTILNGPLFRVPASGGEPVAVTTLDRQTSHGRPHFLPDGQHFLFHAGGTPETQGIYLGSLGSPETTRLAADDTNAEYAPVGWMLWMRAGRLVAQHLDLTRRALNGDPVTLADSVARVSVSAAGLVAYRPAGTSKRQLRWLDRTGRDLGALDAPDDTTLTAPRVSPDGRRAMVRRTAQGNEDLWLLDGTRTSRFTFDPARERNPIWSPDGRRIVFHSNRAGVQNLYIKPVSGSAGETLLLESPEEKTPSDWSSDGRFLLYHSRSPEADQDLWVLALDGEQKPWQLLKTPFIERHGQFSPDGRWVAYMSNESGRAEIYVRPFVSSRPVDASARRVPARVGEDSAGGQWQISSAGGIFPRWARNGRELYYIGPQGQMMAAPINPVDATLEPGEPVKLFDTRISDGGEDVGQGPQFDVTRDGRFLINTIVDESAAPITLLLNWAPPAAK